MCRNKNCAFGKIHEDYEMFAGLNVIGKETNTSVSSPETISIDVRKSPSFTDKKFHINIFEIGSC